MATRCPTCGGDNPDKARFCMSCGGSLATRCPSCGAEPVEGARFCVECGASLAESSPPQAEAVAAREAPPEERRRATVLFADLSGYTAFAERLDPEDVKTLVDRALHRLAAEVERHGGTIDKFIGDAVMAVFGAPVAHEDDPERAVRAALAMQAAMPEVNEQIAAGAQATFALRVGVNSGEVLAGQVGESYTVIGDPVNVASRLQSAARPGAVVVGESTWRLTREAIEYETLAPLELKGKAQPVAAYEARGTLDSGTGRRPSRIHAPLIGRDDESALLVSLFERSLSEGRPHLVTVLGEPGVGKTRLLHELASLLEERPEPPAVRIGSCPAYGAGLAYWAFGEAVREQFGIADTDESLVAWKKLAAGITDLAPETESGDPPERLAALLARLVGIEPPDLTATPAGEDEDPQQLRERLFSAVRSLVEATGRRQPLVLALEDIHWADEGTLDLIEYLARWVRAPVLIVCMARDELRDRRPSWGGGSRNATTIALDPLAEDQTRELAAILLGSGESGGNGALAPQIAARCGGNPLFAEEIVNRIREQGSLEAETLPESVQAVLAARLDALAGAERRVLQHASVVGHTFWEGSLAVLADEGVDLHQALASLEDKDLIASVAGTKLAGEREYAFKHVLIRDVAYGTLPRSVRARKHAEVGGFILERSGDRPEAVVAMLAEHYGRAASLGAESGIETDELSAITDRALETLEAAGDASAALYSNAEAAAHYQAALDLQDGFADPVVARLAEKLGDVVLRLGRVDRSVELWQRCLEYHRAQEELARIGDLHRKIGAALWHKGDRGGSIEHYQRGIDLLKDGPPCFELVHLYEEAASLYMHTGDNMLAIYAAEKALRLAERLSEAGAASRAHGIFGRVFGRIGDVEKARENLERSVELARESDPGEAVRALLTLGYHREVSEADYDGATAAYEEALEIADRTGDLPSQVELRASVAQLAAVRGDWETVERETAGTVEITEREGMTGKLCFPELLRGALSWRSGEFTKSADHLRRAAELAEQVGRSEVAFQAILWLAISLRQRDEYGAADTELARALDLCERAGLTARAVEALSSRAVTLALAGRDERAREAAEAAAGLAERFPYPVGATASIEAMGITDPEPEGAATLLAQAADAWIDLGRPLDAARCDYLRGLRLLDHDPGNATGALDAAADAAESYGITHLAERARAAIPATGP